MAAATTNVHAVSTKSCRRSTRSKNADAVEERRIRTALAKGHTHAAQARFSRLKIYQERSRLLYEEARVCASPISRRIRMETGYRVRIIKPALPPEKKTSRSKVRIRRWR